MDSVIKTILAAISTTKDSSYMMAFSLFTCYVVQIAVQIYTTTISNTILAYKMHVYMKALIELVTIQSECMAGKCCQI